MRNVAVSVLVALAWFTGPVSIPSQEPPPGTVLEGRFAPPPGFRRTPAPAGGFARWLRRLPLKPGRPEVLLFNGRPKDNQKAHAAVVALDVGRRDLQQCADAVIRLRAEYLYERGDHTSIVFQFTSGDPAPFLRWAAGYRPRVNGRRVVWEKRGPGDGSYASFRRYLDVVFTYAGTISLDRELKCVPAGEPPRPGDVFVDPGSPGHAVLVVDAAAGAAGRRLFILVQGFMPAQEIHVLVNPSDPAISPWYEADFGDRLETPEWVFERRHLKRF